MIGKKLLNGLLGLIEGIGILLGYKWRVRLDLHKIYLDFIKPDEKSTREYNRDHFVNGNMYIKGKSNPIKPKLDGKKAEDVISSDRYKKFMGLSLASDLVLAQKDEGWSTRKILLMAVVLTTINICVTLLLGLLVSGGGA